MNKNSKKEFIRLVSVIHMHCCPDVVNCRCSKENTNCPLTSICKGGTTGFSIKEEYMTFKNLIYIQKIVNMLGDENKGTFKCWNATIGSTDLQTIVIAKNENNAKVNVLNRFKEYADSSLQVFEFSEFSTDDITLDLVSDNLSKDICCKIY